MLFVLYDTKCIPMHLLLMILAKDSDAAHKIAFSFDLNHMKAFIDSLGSGDFLSQVFLLIGQLAYELDLIPYLRASKLLDRAYEQLKDFSDAFAVFDQSRTIMMQQQALPPQMSSTPQGIPSLLQPVLQFPTNFVDALEPLEQKPLLKSLVILFSYLIRDGTEYQLIYPYRFFFANILPCHFDQNHRVHLISLVTTIFQYIDSRNSDDCSEAQKFCQVCFYSLSLCISLSHCLPIYSSCFLSSPHACTHAMQDLYAINAPQVFADTYAHLSSDVLIHIASIYSYLIDINDEYVCLP